jgi:hypothetical protein
MHLITVPDLYKFIDEFAESMARTAPEQSEVEEKSESAKLSLKPLVDSASGHLSALTAGDLALKALQFGMVSGISDGLRLSGSEPWLETPEVPEGAPVASSWPTLWSNLDDARSVAHSNWKAMEKDDLHLLWEYGRHQNLDTLTVASRYADKADPEPFQVFLLATFKAGYAVAIAQAVWRFQAP